MQTGAAKQPSFPVTLTGQKTHNAWSVCGNSWLKTPAMDSIARRGTVLTKAVCPYPVCSPSRSSIFTGRMPHETGVMGNGGLIPAGMKSMGELFREAGYNTAYGGKWQLPKSFDGMTGFTKIIGGSALGKDMDAPLSNACSDWLRRSRGGPFPLIASFMNPHDICDWIRQHKGTREYPASAPMPPAQMNMAVDPNEPEAIQYHRTAGYDLMCHAVGIASEWRRDDVRLYLHDYYRMVEQVDGEIGKVLAALRETGQDRDTVIVLASDHGEGLGGHR